MGNTEECTETRFKLIELEGVLSECQSEATLNVGEGRNEMERRLQRIYFLTSAALRNNFSFSVTDEETGTPVSSKEYWERHARMKEQKHIDNALAISLGTVKKKNEELESEIKRLTEEKSTLSNEVQTLRLRVHLLKELLLEAVREKLSCIVKGKE